MPWSRCAPTSRYVTATDGTETLVVARDLVGKALGEGWTVQDEFTGADMVGWTYQRPFDLVPWPGRGHFVVAEDYVTTDEGTGLVHQATVFGADDMDSVRRNGVELVNPIDTRGRFTRRRPRPGRRVLQGRRRDHRRGHEGARRAVPARPVRAQLPALLALPHAADVLRAAVLVRPHDRDQGPPARREREDELVPGPDQARPLRRLAEQQHRLGALARPVLGHAAAGVAQRRRPVPAGVRRLARRTAGAAPASSWPTRTVRTSTT